MHKELNLVSWNDRDPKYDIREWSPEKDKMGKGLTLSKEELLILSDVVRMDTFQTIVIFIASGSFLLALLTYIDKRK